MEKKELGNEIAFGECLKRVHLKQMNKMISDVGIVYLNITHR